MTLCDYLVNGNSNVSRYSLICSFFVSTLNSNGLCLGLFPPRTNNMLWFNLVRTQDLPNPLLNHQQEFSDGLNRTVAFTQIRTINRVI